MIAGCSRPATDRIDVSPGVELAAPEKVAGDSIQHFDFGLVLGHDQTITHDFLLENASSSPLKLTKVAARIPCCSSIGPLPDVVPAGASIRVPVRFNAGRQTGPRRFAFAVETASADRPVFLYTLSANLFSDFEASEIDSEGTSSVVVVNRSGRRRLRITSRRLGQLGRSGPRAVLAASPLSARFAGPETSRSLPEGLVETIRDIEVEIPPGEMPGQRTGEITVTWSSDAPYRHVLNWEVLPKIRAFPPSLVFGESGDQVKRSILLRSDGIPFRVVRITSPRFVEVTRGTSGAAGLHRIGLSIGPPRDAEAGDVVIETDDPEQARVVVHLLKVPNSGEARR